MPAIGFAILLVPNGAVAQGPQTLPEIQVISTSPLGGIGIDRDKVPALVQTVTADDFARTYSSNVTDTLFQRIPGVSTSDQQGNNFQTDIRYRGFVASPVPGQPQGLAVYMNGMRVNEAFGDTVNFDFVPTNAIARADIQSNNPVFGLNALGGAINLQMKNGFSFQGFEGELQGGSHRLNGGIQFGIQKGDVAAYIAAQGLDDRGWRQQSPARLARVYADLGWRNDGNEVHLVVSAASNFFGVVAAAPIELLRRDWTAIYTWPQTTQHQTALIALNGKFAVAENWTLQSNVYLRGFRQDHVDGNGADVERCSNASSFPNKLCLEDDGFPRPVPVTTAFRDQFAVLDRNSSPIPCPPGGGNTCANVPYGTIDRTATDTVTMGASLQAVNDARIFGHDNRFTIGGSIDHSRTNFTSGSRLGFINPDLSVVINPAIPGNGQIIHTLGNLGFVPVDLDARNTYVGLYATDTFDVTSQLSLTVGGRLNVAKIRMADRTGASPDLNNDLTYTRFNPLAGLTYKVMPGLTLYGGYSESNRAPTPLEIGCSNPDRPCLIESALVSDPPLRQVVSRTYEAGLRGNLPAGGGRLDWKIGAYRTDVTDDIITTASNIQGRGVFQNVPATRRQGLEAGVQYAAPRWMVYANTSIIDATYRFNGAIASPNNPMADADGNIFVTPGKKIPAIPAHQFKAGGEVAVTPEWKVGADVAVVGSQYFVGDDSNLNAKVPAYWVANLHTSYQITRQAQLFGLVTNLFNRRYYTYGSYFELDGVAKAGSFAFADPRTVTPAQPLAVYAGLRVKLN
ncbi:MAG TPA: TonB-dependent receptor [Xanthobacteraceae bacterium]|nr:TonB-dependent receptor [Xanthobacteraceae bacterium]